MDQIEKSLNSYESTHKVILGDMNYDYVLDENLYKNKVFNIEQCYDFSQLITEATRVTTKTSTLLGVILSSRPDVHIKSGVCSTALSDHNLTYTIISTNESSNVQQHEEIQFRDYRKFSVEPFLDDIDEELNGQELEWEVWYERFNSICNKHAPIASRRVKSGDKPWIDTELSQRFLDRDFAKVMRDKTNDPVWEAKYSLLAATCRISLKEKKAAFLAEAESINKTKPKVFWSKIKTFMPRVNLKSIPKNINADVFNTYFSNIAGEIDSDFPPESSSEPEWRGASFNKDFIFF